MLEKIADSYSLSYQNRVLVIDGKPIKKKNFTFKSVSKIGPEAMAELAMSTTTADLYDELLEIGRKNKEAEKVAEKEAKEAEKQAEKEASSYLQYVPPLSEEDEKENVEFLEEHRMGYDVLTQKNILYRVKDSQEVDQLPRYLNFFGRSEKEELIKQVRPFAVLYSHKEIPETKEVIIGRDYKTFPTLNSYNCPMWEILADKGEDLHEDHRKILEPRFKGDSFERYCYADFDVGLWPKCAASGCPKTTIDS